ncbi:MAG: succinate dehydrogenase, cytochrome b556 subunit [Sphingomicrobium sp.]
MAAPHPRPLSPHLSIWRWGPHMMASILHRVSGSGLATVGLGVLTWWLYALAKGGEAFSDFQAAASHPLGLFVLIGLSWAFFQHLLSGMRHLVMDSGATFELGLNKTLAVVVMVGALLLTALSWAYILGAR